MAFAAHAAHAYRFECARRPVACAPPSLLELRRRTRESSYADRQIPTTEKEKTFATFVLLSLIVTSLALAVLPLRRVQAATIIVNPGGGGNFTTIQAAINNASPGDTIAIKTGLYNENLDLSLMGIAIGGAAGNLQLVAVDGPGTVSLLGAGIKIRNSGAFNGSLIINGLNISTIDEDGIRLTAFTN